MTANTEIDTDTDTVTDLGKDIDTSVVKETKENINDANNLVEHQHKTRKDKLAKIKTQIENKELKILGSKIDRLKSAEEIAKKIT